MKNLTNALKAWQKDLEIRRDVLAYAVKDHKVQRCYAHRTFAARLVDINMVLNELGTILTNGGK